MIPTSETLHASTVNSSMEDYNASDTLNLTKVGNGTRSEEDPFHDFYMNAQFVTGLICYPIICCYGIIGNVLILVILSKKSMYTSTNIYLSSLAVSDLIKLINDFLYFLTVLLYHTHHVAGNKAFGYLYPYAHFIFNMSVCISSWLIVCVAVERYMLVCHSIRALTLITIPRAKVMSIICFVVMTLLAVPSALRYQTVVKTVSENVTELDVNLTQLWLNETFVVSYNWLQSLLRSIIPLFILAIMNAFIINALRKTRANKKMASRNKITIMLIIVIIFFVVCILPDAVMSAFFNLGYVESGNYLVRGVREITDMLLAVNAAINFTLYMVFNKLFREQFTTVFCGRWCGHKVRMEEQPHYRKINDDQANQGILDKSVPNGSTTKV